ncbi:MAG: hypothetical protein IH987_17205 [Planctomycetes bacterium]|nr:hypothetical protein [Planctomycetota bacterium]
MTDNADDVQRLVSRVKDVVRRLESVAEKAIKANLKMVDALNNRTVNKSISTLEALCDEVESRIQRLREIRRAS